MIEAYPAFRIYHGVDARVLFPPAVIAEIKALACELPKNLGVPLSRMSMAELRREAISRGMVAEVSGATLWRWLGEDAIQPWRHRSWLFPRDPAFYEKATRVLGLYERTWNGRFLGPKYYVLSADEKTSMQARLRRKSPLPPGPYQPMRVEHEFYFSIVQRKVLTPNDFSCLAAVEERSLHFQERYQQVAQPFEWKFTRADLARLLKKLAANQYVLMQLLNEIHHRNCVLEY